MTVNERKFALFPRDDSTLQGIKEARIVFVNVGDSDSITVELHVLGCVKGESVNVLTLELYSKAVLVLPFQTWLNSEI